MCILRVVDGYEGMPADLYIGIGLKLGFRMGTWMSWVRRSEDSNSLCLQWAHEKDFEPAAVVGVQSYQEEEGLLKRGGEEDWACEGG